MYSVLEKLYVDTAIHENPYQFDRAALFDVAARINKKRPFLFVSKVLGKHLAVKPQIPLLTGALLAIRFAEVTLRQRRPYTERAVQALKNQTGFDVLDEIWEHPVSLPEKHLVIGFAETATALGHAFFRACDDQASYIHTTREQLCGMEPIIRFEEEHSHATSHRMYTEDENLLIAHRRIILVDDEISTGKTNLNIIEQLKAAYPHLEHFTVVSILDWRNESQRKAYDEQASRLGITIDAVSLMAGDMTVEGAVEEQEMKVERQPGTLNIERVDVSMPSMLPYHSFSEDGTICTDAYYIGTGRFSITKEKERSVHQEVKALSSSLKEKRGDGKVLVIGTGECMYIPMQIASGLGEDVYFQSTTRSPIYAHEQTLIYNKFQFESPENAGVTNYLYNIPEGRYQEIVIVLERLASEKGLEELLASLRTVGADRVTVVRLTKSTPPPDMQSSYDKDDVMFLLRDLSHIEMEKDTEERERLIQQGTHYAEMLPVEFQPNGKYMELFSQTLHDYAARIATAVGIVAEKIIANKPLEDVVLVSLARAGTPVGILIKRYYEYKYKVNVPHYAVSIIRDRGIDETALLYILKHHPQGQLQFIDGWTGKGAITKELAKACEAFNEKYRQQIDETLAVLADPGHCVDIYGTRDDFLIPSACLNSTVSGLVSRTILNPRYLEEGDFHGAKYYRDLLDGDVSDEYIRTIVSHFEAVQKDVAASMATVSDEPPSWKGLESVEMIQRDFHITNTHYIKPGVGETTRVLLRRVPWKILVNPKFDQDLQHIYLLAEERGVPVETYTNMSYSCCGLIKEMER
ncbi:MAG: phosphoribosyltransferase [Lysinibacillus sp.]